MSYEIYGWMVTACLLLLGTLLVTLTWIVGVENGYDKGFKKGYSRGETDAKQNWDKRKHQLTSDNEYLMGKVVNLFDRENQ